MNEIPRHTANSLNHAATTEYPPLESLPSGHLMGDKQAAHYLDVSPGTLPVWRTTGRYNLPFVKIGRLVRYRAGDLREFIERRTRTSGANAVKLRLTCTAAWVLG